MEKSPSPKFSIILIDCDRHTPREAAKWGVESILAQTFRDFEMIFVHNGFKEIPYEAEFDLSAVEKAKTLCLKEVFDNWGNTSRHYGLKLADGEYVLFFNIDNLLYATCLEKVNQRLKTDAVPRELVIFSIIHHKNAERILTGNPVQFQHIDCLQVVASRKAWEEIGGWHRYEYEADGHLYVQLAEKFPAAYIDEILGENF